MSHNVKILVQTLLVLRSEIKEILILLLFTVPVLTTLAAWQRRFNICADV